MASSLGSQLVDGTSHINLNLFSNPHLQNHTIQSLYSKKNHENNDFLEILEATKDNKKKLISKFKSSNISNHEIRDLLQIENRNLVKLISYSYDDIDASICTISEYDGEKLSEIINQQLIIQAPFDYGLVGSYLAQLVLAVDYLHERNIFHSYINTE